MTRPPPLAGAHMPGAAPAGLAAPHRAAGSSARNILSQTLVNGCRTAARARRNFTRFLVILIRLEASSTLFDARRRSDSEPIRRGSAHASRTRNWSRGVAYVF